MINDLIIYTPMYVTLFWALVLLLSKQSNNRAKQFLGIFMIVAFIVYLSHAVFFKEHNAVFIYFDPLYNFASLSVYPLYFWYIKLLTSETDINYRNLRLLIPSLFFGIATLVFYALMSAQEQVIYVDGFLFNRKIAEPETLLIKVQKGVYLMGRLTFVIQVIVFLVLGCRLIKRYNSRIANFYSNLEDDTIYKDSNLKMTQVSALLKTNRTYISNLINGEFLSSFNGFVNKYRINEAKRILTNDSFRNYSLNYISDEVGFGSLNTFIRVFKESEGVPPGKYRQMFYEKNNYKQ